MRRNYLLQGDKSSVGGVITEGIEGMSNDGVPLAFIGAAVACPACNTTGHIVPTGPRWPGNLMGKQAALDGDLCACRCSPQPVMIAPNAGMGQTFQSSELAAMGYQPDGSPIAVTTGLAGIAAMSLVSGTSADAATTNPEGQTLLDDAQPFEYQPSPPGGDGVLLAGAEGTPGNNQAQNRQFRSVVKALGLNQDQAQELHQEISKQGLGYHEIMQRAIDMFGSGND